MAGTNAELKEIESRDSAAFPPHGPRTDDFRAPDTPGALDGAPVRRSKVRLAAIIGALYLSLFLAALDATIISTAIPTISAHFHSAAGYTWIGGAYLLSNAATGPIWAKLSDIWGRKPIVLAAIAVFFSSSIVCATSISMGMLIAGRAIQGTAGGGLILLANICVSDLFDMRFVSLTRLPIED
jgi:MFS family permease